MCSAENGRGDDGSEKSTEGPSGESESSSLIARLRKEYHNCKGSFNVGGLAAIWLPQALRSRGVPARPGGLSGRELQAVALRVAQQLQDLHLKTWITTDYPVSEEEYVHAMLLLEVPDRAAAQLAVPLSASLAKYPNMLRNLQNLFERADTRGVAFLSVQDLARMYRLRYWRLHPSCNDGRPLTEAELEDPEQLAAELLEAMDVDQDGYVSYAEFVAFCVGRRKREVKLHLYDLSRGAGQQMHWLLGDGLDQIWHTGVVAFDKEYFFSNDTIFDIPGKTSFGEPSQVRTLGYTFWSQDELHDFIVNDLKPIFHRDTYDVICNNCNHFSDRVAMFLTGRPLPEDVRNQADRLMDLVSVRAVRPFLNWLLRDCVVSRDGTARPVEVPHGRWHRITTVEEVIPGTVVAVHPEWGRSTAVLGIVCDSREGEAFGPSYRHGLQMLNCGSYSCMPQNGCCQSHTRFVSAANGDLEVWVKYLDVILRENRECFCACKLRTQKVPVARLSLVTLDGSTFGVRYREALDLLTQQLVTKPGLRSVWGMGEKSAMAESIVDGNGNDSLESHEVPALDPIRLSQAELSPDWRSEVEGRMVAA